MTVSERERLYELLPAIYRQRDAELGEPLRALLAVIQQEVDLLEGDIEQLYDSWFVETAPDWVIPYLGDLLGVRNLNTVDSTGVYSMRAYVANTLRYRQGKGTPAVLEQLANDITGWQARVVEFFQLLATNQHINHLRPANVRTPDCRDSNRLQLLDSPFDTIAHTAEVRRLPRRQGRYNIPNIGLFLWRLNAYPLQNITPQQFAPGDPRFWLHPLGLDTPLFNRPEVEPSIRHLATERNVPIPIRRRELAQNLAAYIGSSEPAVQFVLDNQPVAAAEIKVCHLEDWEAAGWQPPTANGGEKIALDPVNGRFVVLGGNPLPAEVSVSATYGFSGDIGGGPYDRSDESNRGLVAKEWVRTVRQDGSGDFTTLQDAVAAWNTAAAAGIHLDGAILLTDSKTYPGDLTGALAINIPTGAHLTIAAVTQSATDEQIINADGVRPLISGDISIDGTAPLSASNPDSDNPGAFTLEGLLVDGVLRIRQGNLGFVNIRHCTLVPRSAGLISPSASNSRLQMSLFRSICGGIALSKTIPHLAIDQSIIDGVGGASITAPGGRVVINQSTVFKAADPLNGPPSIFELHASESIFTGRLNIERKQSGCVRFCALPAGSRTPRRFQCQPDLVLIGVTQPDRRADLASQMRPQFTSTTYGDPGYAQLSRTTALEIRRGAEDGSEMGAFSFLKQPQRESNLRIALEEYLPFGLEAELFFVT